MKKNIWILFFALLLACTKPAPPPAPVTGSGGSNSSGSGGGGTKPPPVAAAGPDQNITILTHYTNVTLNGKQSFDPSGTALAFSWRQISGPATIPMPNPQFAECWVGYFNLPGTYSFELKVSNSNGTDLDSVDIKIDFPGYCPANRTEIPVSLTFLSDLPEHMQNPELIAAGNKLIVPGWFNNHTGIIGKNIYVYDRVSRNWTTTQASTARIGATPIVAGDKVFFAGGYDSWDFVFNTLAVVDIYNVTTNTWSATQLSEARGSCKVVQNGNRIYFAGGLNNDNGTFSNTIDIYDLESESWSSTFLPGGARVPGAALKAGDKIFFCGGYTKFRDISGFGNSFTDPTRVIDILDIPSGRWLTDSMELAKSSFSAVSDGENLFLAGGLLDHQYQTFAVEKWNVPTMTRSASCLHQPMTFANEQDAVRKDNWLVFFNNSFNSRVDSRKFDIYNTQAGSWSVGILPPGIDPGGNATALTAVNNEIFVIINDKLYKMNF